MHVILWPALIFRGLGQVFQRIIGRSNGNSFDILWNVENEHKFILIEVL